MRWRGMRGDLTPQARRSRIDRDSNLADDEFDYEGNTPDLGRFGVVSGGCCGVANATAHASIEAQASA